MTLDRDIAAKVTRTPTSEDDYDQRVCMYARSLYPSRIFRVIDGDCFEETKTPIRG